MDRSFAGRLGIGGLTGRPVRSARPRSRAGARQAPASRRLGGGFDRALAQLWRLPVLAGHGAAAAWAFVSARRRLRIAAIVALIAMPLLAGGWLWFRGSSLVAVNSVRVSGVHGADASQIDAALTAAARRMSTLDVDTAALRAAVAAYPIVSNVRVSTSFPHAMRIDVIEQPAVAAIDVDGVKTAVASDGDVLGPAHVSGALPTLTAKIQLSAGERVRNHSLLAALSVLGAAPAALAKDVQSAYSGAKGLTLVLSGGVRAYFGDATRPHAKWISLARVLADSSSAGASYIDVRMPERPAAGFPAGVTPPALNSSEAEQDNSGATPSSSESSAALAEGLDAAVGGGSTTTASGTATAPSESEASSSGSSEPSSSGGTEEASSAAASEASGASGAAGGAPETVGG
ncbi:MAG TPA: FtsQ-type POTRA domain-containing protein [Solirubrobacteraceae bacterium]|jgi:cell division protein FtsQ|nr:FtsQ-type POTRA domain-containing protein [Solirubrobacteraceae bacterium]